MTGIVFFKTKILQKLVKFYVENLGMSIWLEQKDCTILSHGNLLIGFCQRPQAEINGMITLFFRTREEVDKMHHTLRHIAKTKPIQNDVYKIYQFFAEDPEGRALEFQAFLHPLKPIELG